MTAYVPSSLIPIGLNDLSGILASATLPPAISGRYRPADLDYDAEAGTCICPAGKRLYQNGGNCIHNGMIGTKFQGAQRDCVPCDNRDQCLRTPDKTKTRQGVFFRGKAEPARVNYSEKLANDGYGQ